MKNESWPTFSFTELLRPPGGWRTDYALLSTYSLDLVVLVTTLLALTGCDLDDSRIGSKVEVVKAIEALRGRVRVLAQAGHVTIPKTPRPILKLLDRFIRIVNLDERVSSWHPKAAFVRYLSVDDPKDRQWRIWLGSRNLTRALNWEAGLTLASRSDGKGQRIEGLADTAAELGARAGLTTLSAQDLQQEFAALTWECPPGSTVHRVSILGPDLTSGFPLPPADTERMFVVSPFLDSKTIHAASKWGGVKTNRTLVSTTMELQRMLHEDQDVFAGFDDLRIQPLPDLPAETVELRAAETNASDDSVEDEEIEPAGLHAKLLFAAKGTRRQLWVGSANATERGWQGRNFEIVAELSIDRNAADGIEDFVAKCDRFKANATAVGANENDRALEDARQLVSNRWQLLQRINDGELEVVASRHPPLADPAISMEVAVLGGTWVVWPPDAFRVRLSGIHRWQRSDFLQIRILRGDRMCSWLQIAPCDPPPDEERDHALIAQYLNAQTFLVWLRSMLADQPARAAGGDWDAEPPTPGTSPFSDAAVVDTGVMPTVEEILRSWARDPSAFKTADEKVKTYAGELERRATESGVAADIALLKLFRQTWETFALVLR